MQHSDLRELIRLIIEQTEDEWEEDDYEVRLNRQFEKLLESQGIKLLHHGKLQTAYIGRGVQARVYDVLWRGKRAVAKVTSEGWESYEKVKELKHDVPKIVALALPEVYDVIYVRIDQKEYDLLDYNQYVIVITEYLVPMTQDIEDFYFGEAKPISIKKIAQNFIEDPEELNKLVQLINKRNKVRTFVFMLHRTNENEWRKIVQMASTAIQTHRADDIEQTILLINRSLGKLGMGFGYDRIDAYEIFYVIRNVLTGQRFPENRADVDEFEGPKLTSLSSRAEKQLYKFFYALKWMDKHTDLHWNDLHSDNVMMRPGVGEFVAADVGLF